MLRNGSMARMRSKHFWKTSQQDLVSAITVFGLFIALVVVFSWYERELTEARQLADRSKSQAREYHLTRAITREGAQDHLNVFNRFTLQELHALGLNASIRVTTGYAPLDPKAVRGMCFSGDPKITASGRKTDPAVTIAAGPRIPFGTWLWIDTIGWRRVDDRGSRIQGDRIDICFATRAEALAWGRRKVLVVVPEAAAEATETTEATEAKTD